MYGRSSSVIRSRRDDVWCILLGEADPANPPSALACACMPALVAAGVRTANSAACTVGGPFRRGSRGVSRERASATEDGDDLSSSPSVPVLEEFNAGSVRSGMTGVCRGGTSICFGGSADEADDECKDGEDVLGRREKLANAAVVFSRAMAAMENRLCLDRLGNVDLAGSRGRDDGGRVVDDDKEDNGGREAVDDG